MSKDVRRKAVLHLFRPDFKSANLLVHEHCWCGHQGTMESWVNLATAPKIHFCAQPVQLTLQSKEGVWQGTSLSPRSIFTLDPKHFLNLLIKTDGLLGEYRLLEKWTNWLIKTGALLGCVSVPACKWCSHKTSLAKEVDCRHHTKALLCMFLSALHVTAALIGLDCQPICFNRR